MRVVNTITHRDLHRIISLQRQIQRDTEQLYLLREIAEGTGSVPTDNLRVQTSLPPSGNRYAEAAADLSAAIDSEQYELKELQGKVQVFIKTLAEPLECRIIHLRYIDGHDWQMISNVLGYSRRHIFRIHNKVVEVLPDE